MDFGRKWQLVHDNVMPGRFYWYDYVDSIFELFCAVIDCNLHNDSVHDPLLSVTPCQKQIPPMAVEHKADYILVT